MTSLRSLTENLEVGHKLAWVAENAIDDVGDRVYPKTITDIDRSGDSIRVEAEGIRGGTYFFKIHQDGTSEAYFVNPNKENPTPMGSVIVARLTNSDDPVPVVRGYEDIRDKQPYQSS